MSNMPNMTIAPSPPAKKNVSEVTHHRHLAYELEHRRGSHLALRPRSTSHRSHLAPYPIPHTSLV